MHMLPQTHEDRCCHKHADSLGGSQNTARRRRNPRRMIVGVALVTLAIGGGTVYEFNHNRFDHGCWFTVNCNIPTQTVETQADAQ
jgi:hypothetical protein